MLETRLQVRMSTDEIEEVKELADDYGLTVSDFIRYLITEELSKGGEE